MPKKRLSKLKNLVKAREAWIKTAREKKMKNEISTQPEMNGGAPVAVALTASHLYFAELKRNTLGVPADKVKTGLPCRITENGTEKTTFETSEPPLEEKEQFTSCFVCCSRMAGANKGTEDDLEAFLEGILDYPRSAIHSHKKRFGPLQNWLSICSSCLSVSREWSHLKEQIVRLRAQMVINQQRLVQKIKSTSSSKISSKRFSKGDETIQDKQEKVIRSIRKYVDSHFYAPGPKINEQSLSSTSKPSDASMTSNIVNETEEIPPDPLGFEMEEEMDFEEHGNGSHIVVSEGTSRSSLFYCGLCDDFNGVESEEVLLEHQKSFHWGPKKTADDGLTSSENKIVYKYSCSSCPQIRNYSVKRFAQHLAIHQRRPYKCSECFQFLPNDESLRELHWNDKHPDKAKEDLPQEAKFLKLKFDPGKIWLCHGCLEGFYTEEERTGHELHCKAFKTAKPPGKFHLECVSCLKTFRNRDEWRIHRVLCHPDVDSVSCFYCEESFSEKMKAPGATSTTVETSSARNDNKLDRHLNLNHSQIKLNRILDECESCGIVFISRDGKKKHVLKVHDIPEEEAYPCSAAGCLKAFAQASTLWVHQDKTHFQRESPICDICGQRFQVMMSLNHHKCMNHGVVEKGYRIIKCPAESCKYQSVYQAKVNNHFRLKHEHEKTRPFECEVCGVGFKCAGKLNRHRQIHKNKDIKPFQCELCGKSFAVRNYLYIHNRLTHEKRTFPSTNKKNPGKKKLKITVVTGADSDKEEDNPSGPSKVN